MNIKNKKGFTLIELIAVIVILIVVFLLAFNYIKKNTQSAKEKALVSNAITYVDATNLLSTSLKNTPSEILNGTFSVADLNSIGVKVNGTTPNSGYVVFYNFEVRCACLQYKKSIATLSNNEYKGKISGKCDIDKPICTFSDDEIVLFNYTGNEQTYTIPSNGLYKLEVWGGQGGHLDETYHGGYGGYSVGEMYLNAGDKLYINVGGAGVNEGPGGYNGGGDSNQANSGSGGGATSIAFSSGLLNTFENKKDDLLIVAGGGGGFEYYNYTNYGGMQDYSGSGGSGGGYIGGSGVAANNVVYGVGLGGTQTEGGSAQVVQNANGTNTGLFGQGVSPNYYTGAGSGGGFYGGGTIEHGPAGGGSGYIGNSSLSNKEMYCFNCSESSDDDTNTTSGSCHSASPSSNCTKEGNGYAIITNLTGEANISAGEKNFYSIFSGYAKTEYIESHGTEYIKTAVTPNVDIGVDVTFKSSNDYSQSNNYMILGASEDGSRRYWLSTKMNSDKTAVLFGIYNVTNTYNQDLSKKTNVKILNSSFMINNNVKGYLNRSMSSYARPITIFALNQTGTMQDYGSYKLYDLSFYQGSNKIAHFIPCYRISDNEPGLCETFEGVFYSNLGTGNFDKGPNVDD